MVAATFGLPSEWLIPPIFAALFLVIILLDRLQESSSQIAAYVGRLDPNASVAVYTGSDETFDAMRQAVHGATRRLLVTYFGSLPPSSYGGARAEWYFQAIQDWVDRDNSHELRRLISGASPAPALETWIAAELERSEESPNYQVRLADLDSASNSLNFVVVDGETTFFMAYGATELILQTFSVRSVAVAEYMADYFTALWEASAARPSSGHHGGQI